MKKWLFVVIVVIFVSSGTGIACAYTYDATGEWLIQPDEGQVILGQEIPNFDLLADISQNGDFFDIATADIVFDGINYGSFGASGSIQDTVYSFTPTIELLADLEDFPGMQARISLFGFELLTESILDGYFDVFFGSDEAGWTDIGELTFAGAPNAVPIPGAVWLLASGILGVLGMRKKMAVNGRL